MVVKQQEHEFVTAIKQMVANQDVAAIDGLNTNEWSVTYLIIAASHLSGDAKAVGARISSVPASARRGAVVEILRELATTRSKMAAVEIQLDQQDSAPNGAPVESPLVTPEVPFDNPVPISEDAPAPARRRRRAADAIAEASGAQAQPAAAPALPAVDFDRAFGDVLSAVGRNTAMSERLIELVPQIAADLESNNRQLAMLCAAVERLSYNAELFRNGVLAFEQELAMNGVISNAVFSEATADWRR